MKKKIFGAVLVVAIAAGAMTNVNLNHSNKYSSLTFESVESLATSEQVCLGDAGRNNGKCKTNANNWGSTCVTPGMWDDKDCYGNASVNV